MQLKLVTMQKLQSNQQTIQTLTSDFLAATTLLSLSISNMKFCSVCIKGGGKERKMIKKGGGKKV